MEKISVIVPVYKVEPYLRRCLDSIVGQTYRNLEIILVDDGSPDGCGAICDEYAARDERIVVIHKENGGVSSARNAGLDAAAGEYIGFVDSDDWIEPDMYAYLMEGVRTTGAEIALCAISIEARREIRRLGYSEEKLFLTEQALEELLEDRQMTNHICNKLCGRELFDGVRYPAGQVYEDVARTWMLFEQAARVFVRPESKYHYCINPNGITFSEGIGNQIHCWNASMERYRRLGERRPELKERLVIAPVGAAMETWSRVWPVRKELDAGTKEVMREMRAFSRLFWREALRNGCFGLTGRLRILLTRYQTGWSYWLAWQLRKLYYNRHG